MHALSSSYRFSSLGCGSQVSNPGKHCIANLTWVPRLHTADLQQDQQRFELYFTPLGRRRMSNTKERTLLAESRQRG